MADEGFKRKLAAILSADVEGYSRLMDDDEEATVRTLTAYRTAIADLVRQFRGRIVDTPGDNILAEFASVVDSVNCAAEIQRDLAEKNAELPDNRKMQFRIGVNLGDVIEEEGRIYGDGVNIAARVEAMASAGGICISGRVYDQIANKLELEYENLGEHQVKNIRTPVRVYRLLSYPGAAAHRVVQAKESLGRKWRKIAIAAAVVVVIVVGLGIWQLYIRRPAIEPASVEKMAYTLPDKPSIVVLPFDNMSGDPKQEYFSDGITEELITALSKSPKLFVVARNSAFTYKGKAVKVSQVAEELGVQYVLEGSVRKEGDRVRITAQLIDALKGNHLWAERYDRDFKDIFALQDEITIKITGALRLELTDGEMARLHTRGTENLDAYQKLLQARETMYAMTPESIKQARRLTEEAIVLDSEYALAYVYLGIANYIELALGSSKSPKKSLKRGFEYLIKAKTLDDSLPQAYSQLGMHYVFSGQHDKAIAECERAIDLEPNSASANIWMGIALKFAGKQEEAVQYLEKALRLDPFPPPYFFRAIGSNYSWVDRHEEAIDFLKKAIEREPNDLFNHIWLTMAYSWAGQTEEARKQAEEVLRINPKYSLEHLSKVFRYKNKEDQERFYNTLREAGLPDKPPLPLPDKPSIAVLAFDNLSGDPEQEYFSDGLSENIITALSKVGELFVIARNSSFSYKGKPVKVQQVSRELGVRYVLEGSVQKSGDRVRITSQLIDAKNGQHLWAENYDRDLKDIFDIQDEITKKIVTSMRLKLTEGEQARLFEKQAKSLDVYLKHAQILSLVRDGTKESIMRYGEIAQEIIDMEPDNLLGYRQMGWYHRHLVSHGVSPRENLKKALMFGKKALAIDESDGMSHALLCYTYKEMRKYEKAIESGKRSIELLPNGAFVHFIYGVTLNVIGRVDEAIAYTKKAIRLNPFPAFYYYYSLGRCYQQKGQYEDALKEHKKALQLAPEGPFIHANLAITYILLGRDEEARASAAKCMELAPYITVSMASKTSALKDKAYLNKMLDAMRKAGFPEESN